jgi:hypothetical protein
LHRIYHNFKRLCYYIEVGIKHIAETTLDFETVIQFKRRIKSVQYE